MPQPLPSRREMLTTAAALAATSAMSATQTSFKLGVDLFSLRSQGWDAFQYLDHSARLGARVVHFSEIRFLGGLDDAHMGKVKEHAGRLGIELEIGMRSICPTSTLFDAAQGTAEEQLARVVRAASLAGSKLVRCFLGSMADRRTAVSLEQHIENVVKVLRAVKSRAADAGIRIAVENHAGDMQARELKMLIEEAGKDVVGACLDSGNPSWTLEDPHLTLETLAPYVLTSHVRDSAVWRTDEGIAVAWTRMGEGNVGIDRWMKRYVELCPGKALSMEIIVTGPRTFAIYDPKFWDGYRRQPAWELSRFLAHADKGKARPAPVQVGKEAGQMREQEDLAVSTKYTKELLG